MLHIRKYPIRSEAESGRPTSTPKRLCVLVAILILLLIYAPAYGQYEEGAAIDFNNVHPNCFISRQPPCPPGASLVGWVSDVRQNMSLSPHYLHIQQRMVIREEVAEENFTCESLPARSYDTTITLVAEHWRALNIPASQGHETALLAYDAGVRYSVTRHTDEGITEIALTTPYPFEMRGFVRDRPITTESIELPRCSELVYISTLPTGTYRANQIYFDTTVVGQVMCDSNGDGVVDQVNGTLRCGTHDRTGIADLVNLNPTFRHEVQSLGDCECGGSGDMDGDGIPDDEDQDMDGDGLGNNHDADTDGDGVPNSSDMDDDNDGVPDDQDDHSTGMDESNDIDGDGVLNQDDDDIDGDGVLNQDDDDMDGDGVKNEDDLDDDGDGVTDLSELFQLLLDLINDFVDFIRQLA